MGMSMTTTSEAGSYGGKIIQLIPADDTTKKEILRGVPVSSAQFNLPSPWFTVS